MDLTYPSDSFRHIKSFFRLILLANVVFLSFICVDAQNVDTGSKTVNVIITDDNNKPLEAAKIILTTGCKCDPCIEKKVDCWVYCCAPAMFTPETLATETTGNGGVFKLKAGQLTPGNYRIKVESGRFTKDVDILVNKDHQVEVIKGPGVLKVESTGPTTALQVPLRTVVVML